MTLVNVLLFDLPVFWWLVLPGAAETQKDGCAVRRLSMHFLHEKNGIWITPHSKLHLNLCGRCTCLQRCRAWLLKITLATMDDYEHPISLILPVCFQLHHFWGEGSCRIWLEFYGLCICVLSGMCMRSVLPRYVAVSHMWQKPAVLFLLVLMPHTPHIPGLFSYHTETRSSISSLLFTCTE